MEHTQSDSIDACPVCESPVGNERVKEFYPCSCGTYVRPEIPDDSLETHSGDWSEQREMVRDRYLESAREKLSFVDDQLDEPGRLLEVGIGTGELLIEAREAGYEPVGIDANEDVYRYCRDTFDDVDVYHGYLEDGTFGDESFDAIMLSHLFEHVASPDEFLSEVHRVLADGGVGYIGTPNAASFAERGVRSQFGGLNVLDHKVLYTPETLRTVLERNGLEVVRAWTTISGFDVLRAFRSWLIERLEISTRQDRTRDETNSEDGGQSAAGARTLLHRLNDVYTVATYKLAPLCSVLFYPYHEWLRRRGIAPMLHCVFRKPDA